MNKNVPFFASAALLGAFFIAALLASPKEKSTCTNHVVKSIVSVTKADGRAVMKTVEIEDGLHVTLYAVNTEVGDVICIDNRVMESIKGK